MAVAADDAVGDRTRQGLDLGRSVTTSSADRTRGGSGTTAPMGALDES